MSSDEPGRSVSADHPTAGDARVSRPTHLGADGLAAVDRLVVAATATDAVAPLSEHALLHLRAETGEDAAHLLVHRGDDLVAVAHVDLAHDGEPASAELVVHPDHRRQGVGTLLLHEVEAAARSGSGDDVRVWAHGDIAAARRFAADRGYQVVRELWQMARPLTEPLPALVVPDGFRLRAFEPGADDDRWLAVNAAAFAHHPEQGAWTTTDLDQRIAAPWFDPAGFLLLVDEPTDELAGFHWTKEHGGGVGEVYVVGVAPAYQGRGLAKPLTLAGLHHLRARGLSTVILYVDGDNAAAVRTYSGLGFDRSALDVQYARG